MWHYQAPLRDMQFVLEDWLQAPATWAALPSFAEVDLPLALQVLEQAGRFSSGVLAPLNASGDRQGCRWLDGDVSTPDGFADAYRAFVEGGWPALACDPEYGGQGLPQLLEAALQEMLYASNHAWAMYTGIAHGAYLCLQAHAPENIKARYLHSIVAGHSLPTMCLTEPQAGSDVGLLRCRADALGDGSYCITGTKLFISGGEHDLTDDILHLVLARLPDGPAGSRGISLFLVPKRLDGGQRNAVRCDGIEHKMGIKGSATCSMTFDGAQGWLIGDAHRGLAAMFVMMNSARLHVGLQGLGHAEAAWQNAADYARQRQQMRAPARPSGVAALGADPIQYHPAMRLALLRLRTVSQGLRVIGYWGAHLLDQAEHAVSEQARQQARRLAGLLTPVIKAFFTDQGFHLASEALQVFGGYGYIGEYAIEQTLRDSRIAMIYEGSNEIQANDLLLRKVLADQGVAFAELLALFDEECASGGAYAGLLVDLCSKLRGALMRIRTGVERDGEYPYRVAGDFLHLLGWVLLAYAWARSARVAKARVKEDAWYQEKLDSAAFFFAYLLPEIDLRIARIDAARAPLAFLRD
jgi:alkylation response protein AidB-like acyl-CoA dehydrogenase